MIYSRRLALRSAAVIGWIILIFAFLYSPLLLEYWQRKTINVFTWTEMIDSQEIVEFERETGIKVNLSYYESNEELFAKLRMTKGLGYDLIIPSDYMLEEFINTGILQKIDKTKLDFLDRINPAFMNLYCDPNNEYSIPYVWSVYGIGFNKTILPQMRVDNPWSLLFDTHVTHASRVMIEDARELILLMAYYLYGSIEHIDEQQLDRIQELLCEQKKYVVSYTDVGASYLLGSREAALALSTSPYILRTMAHDSSIDFIIPTQGSFAVFENIVIPAHSNHQDQVYSFINFLYKPERMKKLVETTYFFSSLQDAPVDNMPPHIRPFFSFNQQSFAKMQFFKNVIPRSIVTALWTQLKS
jgi:spermidine/putrescine transport system substrate-binding protein